MYCASDCRVSLFPVYNLFKKTDIPLEGSLNYFCSTKVANGNHKDKTLCNVLLGELSSCLAWTYICLATRGISLHSILQLNIEKNKSSSSFFQDSGADFVRYY